VSVTIGLEHVRARIGEAALRSGRQPGQVALVGCKPARIEDVLEAATAGLTHIGENRVQEAARKVPVVRERGQTGISWHLIGHLQTNKVREALALFDTIQSVDSLRLAQKLAATAQASAASISHPIYLEVQFALTPGRWGFTPDTVIDAFATIAGLPGLGVRGLMTVAPLGLDLADTRAVFRSLRELRDQIIDLHPEASELGLSMGMTDDFEVAIEEGATLVRIGRAIFAA
jgi:pyridoxal phosphate enzyme (YggS family)